jgi:hypothetical protein
VEVEVATRPARAVRVVAAQVSIPAHQIVEQLIRAAEAAGLGTGQPLVLAVPVS